VAQVGKRRREAGAEQFVGTQHLQHRPQLFACDARARLLELQSVCTDDAIDHDIAVLIDRKQRIRLMGNHSCRSHADAGPANERKGNCLRQHSFFHVETLLV
jgi:hypothetical protein